MQNSNMLIHEIKIKANIHPPNLDSPIFNADHPQPLDDAITALHTLPWTDAIAAPTSITMYSCRTRRPPLDMDDAVATPITTRSCHNITLQLLLASHQLFMMAMASHHRRWHHTDSP